MDKNKNFAVPKPVRPTSKRATTVTNAVPMTSKKVVPKETFSSRKSIIPGKPNINSRANTTLIADESIWKPESSADVDWDVERAYENFLCQLFEECLVEDKIQKEETQMEVQMSQLANRLQQNVDLLDKTNRRLKDIRFTVEQKNLSDLLSQDCAKFYDITEKSGCEAKIDNLSAAVESRLDYLENTNVDIGYNAESGHKQLLDAVNEATEGLERIKKNCKLDPTKFTEYNKLHNNLEKMENVKLELESAKREFEKKFPKFSERLLNAVSDTLATVVDNDEDN
ncbi:uncharacterized protein LOC112043255 [Bicyclus anynana]|uniref:Uncharacterized protein LOC112043255 n=1 Tax=Bicyclus anynana TaxID=110368 RepID=A0A6J1MN50_BICAN|nr:uncharacterized protein LOC112043255 [Bicyclus anynana]